MGLKKDGCVCQAWRIGDAGILMVGGVEDDEENEGIGVDLGTANCEAGCCTVGIVGGTPAKFGLIA